MQYKGHQSNKKNQMKLKMRKNFGEGIGSLSFTKFNSLFT
jgi:hypothetical protein